MTMALRSSFDHTRHEDPLKRIDSRGGMASRTCDFDFQPVAPLAGRCLCIMTYCGWTKFIAHHLRNHGMIRFPCKYQRTIISSWFPRGAGFCPYTVWVCDRNGGPPMYMHDLCCTDAAIQPQLSHTSSAGVTNEGAAMFGEKRMSVSRAWSFRHLHLKWQYGHHHFSQPLSPREQCQQTSTSANNLLGPEFPAKVATQHSQELGHGDGESGCTPG